MNLNEKNFGGGEREGWKWFTYSTFGDGTLKGMWRRAGASKCGGSGAEVGRTKSNGSDVV
jgi:hypothetical protein